MADWEIITRRQNLDGLHKAPRITADMIEKNLRTLGYKLMAVMRKVLRPVKYTGALERSVSSTYSASGTSFQIVIGPTAPHRAYVRDGTRPHWAPLAPLEKWAEWKLGDKSAAVAVQRSIAKRGTSTWIERRGLGDGHGGYDYVTRTLSDGGARSQIEATAQRILGDIVITMGQK